MKEVLKTLHGSKRMKILAWIIYKIITMIIADHSKDFLLENISLEQFGFLQGRQIYEAIGLA